ELQAALQALVRDNFAWEIGGNIATTENEIDDLGGIPFLSTGSSQRHAEGHPIGGFWSRRVVSADRDPATNAITNILCDDGAGGGVACSQAPLVYLGTPTPTFSAAVTNTFTIG